MEGDKVIVAVEIDSSYEQLKKFPQYRILKEFPYTIKPLQGKVEIKPKDKKGFCCVWLNKSDQSLHYVIAEQFLDFNRETDKLKFKKRNKEFADINDYNLDNFEVIKGNGPSKSKTIEDSSNKITWKDVEDCDIDISDEMHIGHFIESCPYKLGTREQYIILVKELRMIFGSIHSTPKLFIFKDQIKDGFKIKYTNKATAKEKLEEIIVGHIDGEAKTAWDIYKKNPELFTFNYLAWSTNDKRAFSFFKGYYYNIVDEFKKDIIQLFLDHVLKVICNGNKDHADYVHKTFAHLLRNPDEKLNTAFCILGKERTGKQTFFTDIWCNLLKGYSIENGDMQHVTGDYNASIEGIRLYVVNESEDATLSKHLNSNRLKKIISDKTFSCRDLYQSARTADNRAFFIFISNNMFPLKISNEDQRYFVLKVSDKHQADSDYFEKLAESIMHEEFYDQLFTYYMKEIDLTDFKYRKIPETEAKKIIQQASGDSVHDFFVARYYKIVDLKLEEIYKLYCDWCDRTKRKPYNETNFKVMMIEEYTGKSKQKSIEGKRPYVYNINEKKLKELIDLNPDANEEFEEKEKNLNNVK